MTETTNFKLSKPENTDKINISDINTNTDKIDKQLQRITPRNSVTGTSISVTDATGPSWSVINNNGAAVTITYATASGNLTAEIAAGATKTILTEATGVKTITLTATATVTLEYYTHVSTKFAEYDAHEADADVHVTTAEKTEWDGKVASVTGAGNIKAETSGGTVTLTDKDTITLVGYIESAGWYRIMTFQKFRTPRDFILKLNSSFCHDQPCESVTLVTSNYDGAKCLLLSKLGNFSVITKLRFVAINSSNDTYDGYLEIYYNKAQKNGITAKIQSIAQNKDTYTITPVEFAVGEIPSGYMSIEMDLSKPDVGTRISALETQLEDLQASLLG